MRQDQPFDLSHQRLRGGLIAKPGGDDPGAALAVQLVVVGIVEPDHLRGIGSGEGAFHVVRERGEADALTGRGRQVIEPLQGAQQMMAIVGVVIDDPCAR